MALLMVAPVNPTTRVFNRVPGIVAHKGEKCKKWTEIILGKNGSPTSVCVQKETEETDNVRACSDELIKVSSCGFVCVTLGYGYLFLYSVTLKLVSLHLYSRAAIPVSWTANVRLRSFVWLLSCPKGQ